MRTSSSSVLLPYLVLALSGACRASSEAQPDALLADAATDAAADAAPMTDAGADSPAPLVPDAGAAPEIGPAGGTVVSKDGRAQIAVPPDALGKNAPISVTAAEATDVTTPSGVYDFGPAGLSFAKDARICLEVSGAPDLSKSCLGYRTGDGKWVCEDRCLEQDGSKLCGSTNHFTSFAILLTGGRGDDASCNDAVFSSLGGTLASPDGLAKLTAPAGALDKPTRITIAKEPTPAEPLASDVFELLPDGTKFAASVELCISPSAKADVKSACLGYLNQDKKWVCEDPCLESKNDQLCGTTSHFTNFALLLSGGKGTSCTN